MEIGKILSLPLTIAVREKISPDFQFQLLLLFISIITDKKDTLIIDTVIGDTFSLIIFCRKRNFQDFMSWSLVLFFSFMNLRFTLTFTYD